MKKCGLKRAYAGGGFIDTPQGLVPDYNTGLKMREEQMRMQDMVGQMRYANPAEQAILGNEISSAIKGFGERYMPEGSGGQMSQDMKNAMSGLESIKEDLRTNAKYYGGSAPVAGAAAMNEMMQKYTSPPKKQQAPQGLYAQSSGGALETYNKLLGFKQGGTVGVDPRGFIKGPGGVDNVPARVDETGEEIRVGAGERIVNKQQNAALEALAAEAGMSLDEYLASATGEPVGPTMKQGLRAAQSGGRFNYDPLEVGQPEPTQPSGVAWGKLKDALSYSDDRAKIAAAHTNSVGTGAQAKKLDAPAQSDPSYDRKEFRSAAGNIAARQEIDNPNIAGLRAAGVTGGMLGDVTERGRTPTTGIRTIDTQNGKVYAGRDAKGQLVVNSNVNPGGLAAADAARDKQFAAAGYGKDSYGNWMTPQRIAAKQALEQIQRDRAQFYAFSDQVTDPRARAAGLRRVAFDMANDAQATKRAQENAKLRLEAAKFDQEERKINNLQGNSDREFNQKVGETNAKRLDDYIKAKATKEDGKLDGQAYSRLQEYVGNFKSKHKEGTNAYYKDLMDNLGVDSAFMADEGSLLRRVRNQGSDVAQGLRQQDGMLWGKYLMDPSTNRQVSFSDIAKMPASQRAIIISRMEDSPQRTELLKKLGVSN